MLLCMKLSLLSFRSYIKIQLQFALNYKRNPQRALGIFVLITIKMNDIIAYFDSHLLKTGI